MAKKTILIIANLDTRGAEFKMVKELIESQGHNALLLDFSMEQEPFFTGDITCEEVANEGGLDIEAVRQFYRTEREKATENQIRGARKIVRRLMEEGKVHGVIGVGGGTASLVATSVMRKLPFGMPKLMASSMAAHPKYVGKYVGTKDITMLNTVVDVVEINPILKPSSSMRLGPSAVWLRCHRAGKPNLNSRWWQSPALVLRNEPSNRQSTTFVIRAISRSPAMPRAEEIGPWMN